MITRRWVEQNSSRNLPPSCSGGQGQATLAQAAPCPRFSLQGRAEGGVFRASRVGAVQRKRHT